MEPDDYDPVTQLSVDPKPKSCKKIVKNDRSKQIVVNQGTATTEVLESGESHVFSVRDENIELSIREEGKWDSHLEIEESQQECFDNPILTVTEDSF
jgi:hypothetical protein